MNDIVKILGTSSAEMFNYHYGVQPNGNTPPGSDPHGEFTNKNILHELHSIEQTASHFGKQAEEVLSFRCFLSIFDLVIDPSFNLHLNRSVKYYQRVEPDYIPNERNALILI